MRVGEEEENERNENLLGSMRRRPPQLPEEYFIAQPIPINGYPVQKIPLVVSSQYPEHSGLCLASNPSFRGSQETDVSVVDEKKNEINAKI